MTERKERYKLYKAKKLWVTAMIATGIFIGTSVAIDPVNAATQTAVTSSSAGTSASVANTSSVNSSASVASATSSSAMLSVSEGSNAATSSANSSAISNSASQSPAASSSTANSAATSSNTASSTAASQGSNAAVNTAISSVNSSATSSSASQSPVASSSTANSAATSSNTASSTAASQGSSAASSSSATTSSTKVALKLNVLAATSTSLQSVATSSSVSSRHLTDNNFADKDGSTPLTAPTFMTSSGDFEMSLELSGQTGDVFTFTLPTDQSDTSAYPVVINENSLEGGSSYNITSSSNHQIVITFKSNGIVTFPIKLHYLLGSKETPAGAAGWYYGKQIRQMTLSGVDGRGESLGTVTKDITLDNTISPSITAKRVINSSTIVNNVDYEYQASVTNLPQNNTIFLTMGNDNPVTFTVTMPTGFVLNETYTNKKMDALLGAGNYSIAYDQASGVLSVTVSDPAKTFGKSKASSVVADFVGHYENQSGTDTATAGPSINGVLGSNQVPFQATGTALSETFKTSEASEGDINFTYKYAHPDNQQIKLNNDQHAYLAEIGVRSNKTTTVTNQDLQLTMPTEFDVNANQLTLSHQIYGTGADSTKLTYTVKYADGSSKNYTYGDTPFSDLPAQRISQITLHIAELDPSEEYDIQINGTVDTSVAKDGDEASIEYSLANQGTTVSSPSKLTQTIVTTPAATGTLWTYPVNTIAGSDANGNNSSRWELGETIGTIESPTFYFVLPTGFYYNPTKYGDNWVATDEKQYQTTTTYYANGHQVIKVAFQTGHTFVGTGNAGQVQFILNVSADSTVVPGEYKVMSYISSPNVKWANMASLTNTDLSYLDVDANASDTGKSKSFANRKTDYVTLTVSNVAKSLNNNSGIAIDGEDGILSAVTTNGQVDDRGDGKTTLGMNVYSTQAETTGFVYKGALPVNDITGKQDIVLTGPVTIPSSISDTVSILYATGDVDLNNIETTNYVTANKITDWSKVTGVALIGTKIATGVHAQVNLPVQVLNVSDKSGTKYKFNTALFKNSLPNQPLDMTATLTVTGKSTIKTRVEYTDTDGTTKYKDLEYTKTYTDGEDTPKASDFPSSTGDTSALAQYSPTFSLDDQNTLKDLLQNRIMPNDPNMGSINLRSTVTPSEDGYYVTYVLADKTETTTNTKNFTRTINIKKPDGATETVAQTAPIGQQVTKDLITGKTTTYPWGTSYWQSYTIPVVNGYIGKADTTDGKIDPQKIDENSSDTIVNITYTKLGSILPVDESDNSLGSNTTYANDPDDGSKAATTNAPTIPGYHVASTQTNSNITVSGSGNNTTATVTPVDQTQNTQVVYEPNTETATVKFIDNDNSSQEISGTAITSTGKYGQTITFTINPETELKTLEARGYELVSDDWADKINSTYKDGNNIFEIHLKHQIKQFVPANPTKGADDSNNIYHDPVNGKDYPAFEAAALTVTYTGAGDATPKAQTITVPGAFYKNFTYDAVTGAVVSEDSNWTSTNKPSSTSSNFAFDSSIYEAYENGGYGNNDNRKLIPSIIGYKAGYKNGPFIATLPLIQLGANAGGNTVTYTYSIIYTANDETAMIKFIDDTTGKAVSDSALNTDGALTTTGKYGETISFTTDPETELANLEKKGYTLVSDGWKNKTSTTYQDGDANNTFEIHLKHLYAADLVSKSVTRTINYVDAKDTSKPVANAVKQRATLTRNHIKDNVTGDYVGYGSIDDNSDYVSNDAWNVENQTWVAVASPDLSAKGYEAPDQTKVDAVTVDGNTQDATITVTYDHKTVTVQPNNPKTTTDPLPDNPTSNYPSGVDEKDLKKTITRTIKLTTPNGKETDETQTVTLSRTATVDEVNGGVTYSYWSTGTWDSYTPKSVTGYTPKITIDDTSASSIAQTTVSHDTNDSTVIITYTPDSQKLQIHIYDVDKNATIKDDLGAGESGVTLEIDGVSNQAYDETSAVQKLEDYYKGLGYKLAPVTAEHPLPVATGTFDTNDAVDQAINIYLVHDIEEQTQKVTRTINYQTTETHKQVAGPYTKTVTVIAMVDRVTGNALSYTGTDGTSAVTVTLTGTKTKDGKNAYTITIPGQKLPTYAGYTAQAPEATSSTQAKIFNETLSGTDDSLTETVNYTPNDQQLQIRVFDDTTDPDSKTDLGAGQSGDQVNFSGKTDETVPDDVKAKVDDLIKYYEGKGYVLVSTGTIPTKYDNTDNTGDTDSAVQHVDIHLKHGTKTITATQTNITYTDPTNNQQYQLTYDATRTITYQGAGNQTPAEKAETVRGAFTRQLTVDAVTGKVQTVDLWTGSYDYASVSVTPVTGYVADKVTVPAVTASADNLDENGNPKAVSQTVTYTAVGRIIPVDANGKHLVDPQNYKNDSADPTKVAKNETLPTIPGYHVVSGDGVTTSGTGNNTTGTITPTNATTDTEVIYAPNAETITVRYVDADAKDPSKATLKTDTLNGNFGTDINYSTKDEIAKLFNEGYVLRQDSDDEFTSANQTQYTVENDGKTYIVTLHHGTEKVTTNQQVDGKTKINENDDRDDAPVWTDENGIVSADFTRTINYVASDGTSLGLSTQTQNAHWTRELTVDKVTGEVVNNTDWTTTNTYPAVTSPTVAGYTPDTATVAEVTRPEQQNTIVTVTYTPDKQTIQVQYVDDDDNGKIVTTTDLNGVTNQTVTPEYNIPANYEYVSGKEASYTFKASGNQPIVVHLKHQHKTGTETKTITRTVNITDPKTGKTTTTSQQVNLTRSTDTDLVTNKTTNGEWNTGTWDEVSVPKVPGYTPSQASVDEATVKDSDTDQTVDITYTPNDQTGKISYVGPDGSEIGNTPLNGKTDSTVNVTPQIPAGWVEVPGQTIPTTTTATADGIPTVTVKVQHGQVTVQPDDPKTPSDKLPDNPGKNFPSGVSESDLNKTITRTINVTKPDGTKTTKTQTVHLTRTATVDEVTGKVTYSNWTTGTWDAYTPANIPGYTPSQASVGEATVTGSDTDQTVDITYTANSQKATINYVDDDDHGKIVHTTPLSGKTDQTVPVTNEIPAGYQLADGSTVPDSHTFTPGGPDTITVHLVHKHDQGSETHQATRTITVTTPDGKSQIITQTGTIKRSTDTDEVTKTTKYGDWSVANWSKYDAPVIPGYTASVKTVDAGSITPDTKDSQVTITYTANPQSTTIQYVDDDNGGQQVGELTTLSGKTDQTVTPEYNIPANYEYVSGKEASYTFKASGNQPIVVHLKHHHTTTPDQKTVTRTITVTTPDGKQTTTTQTATSTRTIDTDEVTGKQTPGAWQPATWDKFTTPTIDGYVPTVSQVAAKTVTGDTPDEQINITYSANPQTATVTYVDDETGKTVHVTNLHGDTATTVSVPNEVPAGYDLVGTFPSNYTFTSASQQGLTIHLTHHKSTVPETKTVTRTIKLQNPDGTTTTITQKATISRQVTTDAVNGNQTFTPWTTALWAKFEVPTFKGYTPSQLTVAPVTVDGNSQDEAVTITYATDPAAIVYFLDEDQLDAKGQPSQVATSGYLSGNFNGPITDPNYAQTLADLQAKGYLLDDQKSTYPTQDKFDTDPKTIQTFYVYLKHQTVTTSEKKTVTRTIKVNNPDGTTKTITQAVTIGRQITTDKVTGKQTASGWSSANWTEFKVPTISGYTPSQTTVPTVTVDGSTTDQTVTINYTANPQTVTVKYVDDTTGATIKTTSIQGVAGQTVTIPDDVPSGYQVVGQLPGKYTLTSDDGQTITVHLTHQMTTVPEKKTVTRTITIIKPDGTSQTVTQTATITRRVTTDHVTGGQTFTPWSTAEWPVFNLTNLAVIPGYTPMVVKGSTAHVMVDGTTEDTQTQIVYVGQTQSTTIQYVDDETGKVVQTTNLSGKTGETVTPSYQTPSGYDLVDPSQAVTSYTFKASGNQPIIIHLKHHKSTMPETKTVTRTITVINPDGTTKTVTQTATITRQVTTDQVTGEQTATDWTTAKWPAFNVPTLEGYTAKVDGAVEAVTVDATTADQVVTITYIKQATPNQPNKPNKPDQPTVNPTPSQPTSGAPVKPNSSGQSAQGALRPTAATNNDPAATTKTARLPQTGNDNSMAMLSLGFASLVATLGLVIAKKREDQK